MACTKIKAIKCDLSNRIDYIMNEEKTAGGILVSGYGVAPETASIEFGITRDVATEVRGDVSRIGGADIKAYHMIQAFSKKDRISAEEAHELGKQWADDVLGGKYEYVIATHVDRDHIHNHVIFNATSCDDYKKFRTELFKTVAMLREKSDQLCEQRGLYVIENPRGIGQQRVEYNARRRGTSWKQSVEQRIDSIIPQVADYEEFEESSRGAGIEITRQGKYTTYQIEGTNFKVRSKNMDPNYSREGITASIRQNLKKDIRLATMAGKLVEAGENTYFARIPYTNKYVRFEKANSFWYANNKALGVYIDEGKVYTLCDRQGKRIGECIGSKLLSYYQGKEVQEQAQAAGLVQTQVEEQKNVTVRGSLSNVSGRVMSFAEKTAYQVNRNNVQAVREMAHTLSVLSRAGIDKYTDIERVKNGLQDEIAGLRNGVLNMLEEKGKTLHDVAGLLITVEKYQDILDKVEAAGPLKRLRLERQYADELKAVQYAKERIEKMGLDANINPDELKQAIGVIVDKKQAVLQQINTLRSRSQELDQAAGCIEAAYKTAEAKEQGKARKQSVDRAI